MRRLLILLVLLLGGCGSGVYTISKSDFHQQVKTLGVLPILVDTRSEIKHPQADEVITLLRRAVQGRSEEVVRDLRHKKGFFDVRQVAEPPRLLADKLLKGLLQDATGRPNGYKLDGPYLAQFCHDAVVDGVLILTLQGVQHQDKRWSRNTFESLDTQYNEIMASAMVVAADGRLLWQRAGEKALTILPLQYADFDEAYFNRSEDVRLKLIGFAGLEKTLLTPVQEDPQQTSSRQISAWLKQVAADLSPSFFF